MKLVLDASVAVAAVRAQEASHARARLQVDRVLRGEDEIVVPSLFRIEVVASLARRGHDPAAAEKYAAELLAPPTDTISIGPRRAALIATFAGRARFRAADACYVWVASRRSLPLVTLDEEMVGRSLGVATRLP